MYIAAMIRPRRSFGLGAVGLKTLRVLLKCRCRVGGITTSYRLSARVGGYLGGILHGTWVVKKGLIIHTV